MEFPPISFFGVKEKVFFFTFVVSDVPSALDFMPKADIHNSLTKDIN